MESVWVIFWSLGDLIPGEKVVFGGGLAPSVSAKLDSPSLSVKFVEEGLSTVLMLFKSVVFFFAKALSVLAKTRRSLYKIKIKKKEKNSKKKMKKIGKKKWKKGKKVT